MNTMKNKVWVCLFLAACSQEPTALEKDYEFKFVVAQQDCVNKGGDIFRPLGVYNNLLYFSGRYKASLYTCIRYDHKLGVQYNKTLSIYKFRVKDEVIEVEIR